MMKGWTIRRLIVASFAVILLLMIGTTAIAYLRLARIEQEARSVQSGAIPALYYSTLLQETWSDNFTLTQEYLLETDARLQQQVQQKLQSNRSEIDGLLAKYETALATVESRQALDAFKNARNSYVQLQDKTLAAAVTASHDQAARSTLESSLVPEFERGKTAISRVVQL